MNIPTFVTTWAAFACSLTLASADPLGTAFTYQGRLAGSSGLVSGRYDLAFSLWDAPAGPAQLGLSLTNLNVPVSNGLFTATLDFGAGMFDGSARWLEIAVRTNSATAFTLLAPRQPLAATPFAHYAPSAGAALQAASVSAGGITTAMLADSAVTSAKIEPGAVKPSNIDDGGEAAYGALLVPAKAFGAAAPLPFNALSPVSTSGGSPAFTFRIDNVAFGVVAGFVGSEAISEPYNFVVEVIAPAPELDANAQIGRQARLTISRNGRNSSFGGIVTACSLASWDGRSALYTFRLESPLAYLALTTDYRIFQNTSVPDIASTLYQTLGHATPSQSLLGSYPARELAVQYAETTLNFFSRLLEAQGIFYFFNLDGPPPVLVLGDNINACLPCPNSPFRYYGNTSTEVPAGAEFLRTFQIATRESVVLSTLRAYNFQNPGAALTAQASGANGQGESYHFGSASPTQASLSAEATKRQQRHDLERATHFGTGNVPDLRPGFTFVLDDRTDSGLANTYLVTAVRHAGFRRSTTNTTLMYGNEFDVIPASMPFRPALKTPRPSALPCTANVTGPADAEPFVDSYARVKVQFHWDRYGAHNETSSAWIRVASPMAGTGRGMLFLPRAGDEVLVQFLQGDPDQPVLTGSLYNADASPPYALPANKTVSTIKSRSTPSAGSVPNEIRFEDKSGAETLEVTAAKDLSLSSRNYASLSALASMDLSAPTLRLSAPQGVGIGVPPDAAFALKVGGTVRATAFQGDGSQLSGLPAGALTGTVLDAQLPSNLPRLGATQVFTGNNSFLGSVGLGGGLGPDPVNIAGNARLNDYDLYFRANNGDRAHGLGWYGSSKPFGSSTLDGPVLYGCGGGSLGTICGGQRIALTWNSGGNVGIGLYNPASTLDVAGTITATGLSLNGDARVTGLVRSGSELGTSNAPNFGLVVRRVNSTSFATGQVLARTDKLTLERDGTTSGLLIRYAAYPGIQTVNALGISNAGTLVPFRATLNNPATASTIQIFTTAQRIVHAQVSFGNPYNSGQLTQVVVERYDDAGSYNDNFWVGTLTSTYNQ